MLELISGIYVQNSFDLQSNLNEFRTIWVKFKHKGEVSLLAHLIAC